VRQGLDRAPSCFDGRKRGTTSVQFNSQPDEPRVALPLPSIRYVHFLSMCPGKTASWLSRSSLASIHSGNQLTPGPLLLVPQLRSHPQYPSLSRAHWNSSSIAGMHSLTWSLLKPTPPIFRLGLETLNLALALKLHLFIQPDSCQQSTTSRV